MKRDVLVQYLFGDTDIAARRLQVLAEVFAESTRAFLLETNLVKPRLAVDLGCGPGHTTHLLAQVQPFDRVIGLDNSEYFISLAQTTQTEKVSFSFHDVTTVPFPAGPGDLLYCRFLLTHLREPQAVVAQWATQLRPKGLLLVEEVEWICTEHAVFTTYLKIVEAFLEHQSNKLYVGPFLNGLEHPKALERRSNQVRQLAVTDRRAATMFYLNMQSWKSHPFIRTNFAADSMKQLEKDLYTLATQSGEESEIEWGLRQIVYERV